MNAIINESLIKNGAEKMKQGRPGRIDKSINRVHSVVLSERAEFILRETIRKRNGDTKWINRYVSEYIIKDFENNPEAVFVHQLNEMQKQRNLMEEQIQELSSKIAEIRQIKARKELAVQIKTVGLRDGQ
jgi:hypothetical protein